MGTPATVLAKQGDNYRAIYNNFDGYPSYLLKMLQEHYQDEDKVQRLIDLGDVSSIRKEVDIPAGVTHSYGNAHPDITIAYGRDRGEDRTEYRTYSTLDEALSQEGNNTQYVYLWENNKWNQL